MFDVKLAIDNNEVVDKLLFEDLLNTCDMIIKNRMAGSLTKNYSPRNMMFDKHKSFGCMVLENQIVGFCGMFNDGRYEDGLYRITNRAWVHPKIRSTVSKYVCTTHISKIFIENNPESTLFISREGEYGNMILAHMEKNIPFLNNWIVSETQIPVVNGTTSSCNQFILSNRKLDHVLRFV